MTISLSSQSHYVDRRFAGLRLAEDELQAAAFHDCIFDDCSLAETVFRDCRFVSCTFQECDLSLAQVPGSAFSGVRFEDCKLIGLDWTQADWEAVRLGRPFDFFNCALNHATFIGLSLKGIQIVDCLAVDVDFREANLTQADFKGTDLDQSLFANTVLKGANFRSARNYHINPAANSLEGARFTLPEAMALLYAMDIVLAEEDEA